MPSKKELYKKALSVKSVHCPPISKMNKKQLETYIAGRSGAMEKLKPIKEQAPIKQVDVIAPRGGLSAKEFEEFKELSKFDIITPADQKKLKTLKIKIKKEKKKPKTIKIKIKKMKMMDKLESIPEQKTIAPAPVSKVRKSIQTVVLAKFNKMKKAKKDKVEEKGDGFLQSGTAGLLFNPKNKHVKFRGVVYNPFSVEQFERMVNSLVSHEDGVKDPKLFGMNKTEVKASIKSIQKIKNSLDTERL
jgi:hypothetical protein